MDTSGEDRRPWNVPWEAAGLLILSVAVAGVFARYAIEFVQLRRLQREGIEVSARVVDAAVLQMRGGPEYRVRYEFSPPGREATWSGQDSVDFVRTNRWNEAVASKQITVRYVPADPTINRWTITIADRVTDTGVASVVFGLLAVLIGIVAVVAFRMPREEFEKWWYWN